jgi:capsular exopolysaccharide synthesis family protein
MPRSANKLGILLHQYPSSPLADSYRTLRINIDFASTGRPVRTIAVTSANQAEGKTTTALNLAVAYAQVGRSVLLLDADLRKPSVHSAFGLECDMGLMNVLTGGAHPEAAIRESGIPGLSVMTAGRRPFNASELLASSAFDTLLESLKTKYDTVLIDTPPILSAMDAKIVASKTDGVLLVAEYRKVKRDEAVRAKEELAAVHANLLGVAFNKINAKDIEMYSY